MKILEDKVIIITGGSRGIGASLAKDFIKLGAKVAIFDLDEVNGNKLINEVNDQDRIIFQKVDITIKKDIEKAVENIQKKIGPVTSWINSAGISKMIPFLDNTEELWDTTIDVNLKGTFLCCQVAINKMLENGGGEIINMSSLSGKKASSWQAAYCASKFGVQGLTQSIAKEFANKNIRVNSICPGIVETEMWEELKYDYSQKRKIKPSEVMDYFKKSIPMNRLVDLKDITNAAIFLLTESSSYLTGQSINLVGGEWMD